MAQSDLTCRPLVVFFSRFCHKLIYALSIWETASLLTCAAVEDGLAITAASIPALKLLTQVLPSTTSDNYNMIPYPHLSLNCKIFDNSQGETQTDIGHMIRTVHGLGSQTAILEPVPPKGEKTNMTIDVLVTYNNGL
ncbi:hypothetical protein PITC_070440 [Penicillium italicum]|uniref:Uncharacterized protein n=1 Tax=Penicillium italicum TaxID=40296 RepID=A0A0A2KKV8_PENIT|nr:hypothetical protein PITC_070440 [Penicillium italicum]